MKLITFNYNNKENVGILDKETIHIVPYISNMIKFIELYPYLNIKEIFKNAEVVNLKEVELLSPIVKPSHDVICIGKNYEEHIKEVQGDLPGQYEYANYFGKRASRIIGIGEDIKGQFQVDEAMDYEVELAVIIGRECSDVEVEDSINYVFGYSVFNDISARNLQKQHNQWFRGKGLDNYSVMGPCIVTKDEVNHNNLNIKSYVDDEIRQSSNTCKMIFKIENIISELSKGMTLYPGDIIATGTPEGVGIGFNPPKYLKKNSTIKCEIEGIGVLYNKII